MPLLPPPFPVSQIGFLGPAFFLTRLGGITSVAGAVGCMMAAQVRSGGKCWRGGLVWVAPCTACLGWVTTCHGSSLAVLY